MLIFPLLPRANSNEFLIDVEASKDDWHKTKQSFFGQHYDYGPWAPELYLG